MGSLSNFGYFLVINQLIPSYEHIDCFLLEFCFSSPSGASQHFCRLGCAAAVLLFIPQTKHNILLWARCSHVYTHTHIITQHFLPCFCLRFIWMLEIPVCKHSKTISIVADNKWLQSICTCLCICMQACMRECWRACYTVSKCTNTHTQLLEIPESHRKAALFLLLNEKPIVQSVCPRCHSRPSMKHPSVSIGYLLHKIHTQQHLLCS